MYVTYQINVSRMSHTEDPYEVDIVGAAMVSISICFLTKWSIVRVSHTMCFELFHECVQRSVLRVIENIPAASIIDFSTP